VIAVTRRLKTSDVHVVSLAAMTPPLWYRAARDGVLVICRDRAVLERFVLSTLREYLDFQPQRDRAFRTMGAAILDGSDGRRRRDFDRYLAAIERYLGRTA
jgi:hypothetical protein